MTTLCGYISVRAGYRGNAGWEICRNTMPASSMTRREAASIEYESE